MAEILNQILGPVGALVLALGILVSGWKRMWVFGWQYKDVENEKNEWKSIALKGAHVAERVVSVAEKDRFNESP